MPTSIYLKATSFTKGQKPRHKHENKTMNLDIVPCYFLFTVIIIIFKVS